MDVELCMGEQTAVELWRISSPEGDLLKYRKVLLLLALHTARGWSDYLPCQATPRGAIQVLISCLVIYVDHTRVDDYGVCE